MPKKKEKFWIQKNGSTVEIKSMSTKHIINTIKMLKIVGINPERYTLQEELDKRKKLNDPNNLIKEII